MNIYIACGLTHVPRDRFDSYVQFIHELAHRLSLGGSFVRYALRDSDPQLATKPFEDRARLCYSWDHEMVETSDVLVAEASYPSTGLGIELQIATSKGIPIVVCFEKTATNRVSAAEYLNPDHSRHVLQVGEGYVSLMALGVPTIFKVIGYKNAEDAFGAVVNSVALLGR